MFSRMGNTIKIFKKFYNCDHNFTIVITIVKFLQMCDFCHFLMFYGVIDGADHYGVIYKFTIVITIVQL